MTNQEAIFCMKQYLPDSDSLECMKCPYYHTIPIEGTENGFTCKADEAHKMAIKALEQGDVLHETQQEIVGFRDDPEMFVQDSGMKPADEYVTEFMTKLKNGKIKG